jgi:vitamin B12 transporter
MFLAFLVALPLQGIAQNSKNINSTAKTSQSEDEEYRVEEIVVSATRIDTPSKEVGNSITVITQQQIEEQQQKTVLEVFRSVPALDVVQTGGPGRTTSVFMRGAKSEHTLVLIDGVEMNDPISTGRSYDFANLTTDNIERIEILRGPQSTLYGSDAVGGVINIITKKGKGKPSGYVSFEGGSYNTFKENAGISGGNDRVNYSLGVSRWDTDGISAAAEKDGNTEKDAYGNTSVSGRFGITPAKTFGLDLIYRFIDSKADLDGSGGTGGDDPNSTFDSKQHFFRAQSQFSLFDNLWKSKIGFSLSNHDRSYRDDVDDAHPADSSQSTYNGWAYKIDWQNDFYLHEMNTLSFGLETEKDKGESEYYSQSAWGPYTSIFSEKEARTTGFYVQDQIKVLDSWFTTIGVRVDDHSKFGTEPTWRIASAYVIEQSGTKFKMSFGTGFKAPSLYQLYSEYGDVNLQPEKSTGWDAGIEQSLAGEKMTLGVSYFSNDFENMVDFNSATYTYANVANAETRGVEAFVNAQATERLAFRASYTYTDTEDNATGLDLLRRANHKFGFNANYRFLAGGNINFGLTHIGKRADTDYSSYPYARVQLDDYILANLAASYTFNKTFEIFGRIDNLFDRDYEEVRGYGTPGAAAYGGLKLLF